MTLEFRIEPTKKVVVIVASDRIGRPKSSGKKTCPFDAGREYMTPPSVLEITTFEKPQKQWLVRATNNKYPFLSTTTKFEKNKRKTGAYGVHEVIIETPFHGKDFEDLDEEEISLVFGAYVNRFIEIGQVKGTKYVYLFKNYGKNAGASINHEHSQIVGLPFIPEMIESEFKASKNKCLYCNMLRKNIVFQNSEFVVMRPEFARFPLECWIIPKKHVTEFTSFNKKTALLFMKTLQEVTRRIKRYTTDYNVAFHASCKNKKIHFHVEVYPHTSKWAGLELGAGVIVNIMNEKNALNLLRR